MSWIDRKSCGAVLALALASGVSVEAATLVVRSSGPSAKLYPPGKALADNARLALKAGDGLTLLDARGSRTLTGPGQFTAASSATTAPAGAATRIAALASAGGVRRARIGAVRGALSQNPLRAPNVWFVDAAQSATACVADPQAVTLWRSTGTAEIATITGEGKSAQARFAAGQSTTAWPATLPVADGARYAVQWAAGAAPTTITFAVVAPKPAGLEDMAAQLIRHGCQPQLDMLIETVALPAASTGTPG